MEKKYSCKTCNKKPCCAYKMRMPLGKGSSRKGRKNDTIYNFINVTQKMEAR
jgi:hypothetical protein